MVQYYNYNKYNLFSERFLNSIRPKFVCVNAGELPIPTLMCVTWYALDVLFTSSTIIHLTMISIDRYMALKFPLRYGAVRTKKQTILKIFLVWVIAFAIAGPLFVLSMQDRHNSISFKGCGPETPIFVVTATLISFYIPLLITSVMYILTVYALHQQAKQQKQILKMKTMRRKYNSYEPPSQQSSRMHTKLRQTSSFSQLQSEGLDVITIEQAAAGSKSSNTLTVCKFGTQHENGRSQVPERVPMLKRSATEGDETTTIPKRSSISSGGEQESQEIEVEVTIHKPQEHKPAFLCDRCTNCFRWFSQIPCFRKKQTHKHHASTIKSRKAVQVLGIVFAVFVVCYLPFFLTYLIKGTCRSCQPYISPTLLKAFEWLEYSGSMLNPIIYHIFNKDFRKAFHRFMKCKCS